MAPWRLFGGSRKPGADGKDEMNDSRPSSNEDVDLEDRGRKPAKWSFGILNDKETDEVPGSVLLLSKVALRNEPLGLQYAHARTSSSSLPSPYPPGMRSRTRSRTPTRPEKKRTPDGKIILEPQPEESQNDPLNWRVWRRDAALFSLGFYCMLGGGMTTILAAGFNNVATTFHTTIPKVALTTGLYMMGLGVGSVIMSPTAILFGKRPVYLSTAVLFVVASIWCGLSPSYPSLVVARIVQGIAVSPVECLPSATIAEIFFLHERAYRLGVYTLLLLGGKNLVPLVSALIIQSLGWRWVFYVVAIIVGFGGVLLFFFVPETYWNRTPRPARVTRPHRQKTHSSHRLPHLFSRTHSGLPTVAAEATEKKRRNEDAHVAFDEPDNAKGHIDGEDQLDREPEEAAAVAAQADSTHARTSLDWQHPTNWAVDETLGEHNPTLELRNLNSPYYVTKASEMDYFSVKPVTEPEPAHMVESSAPAPEPARKRAILSPPAIDVEKANEPREPPTPGTVGSQSSDHAEDAAAAAAAACRYTDFYRDAPPKSFWQTLAPYSGRLSQDAWLRVMLRPFILFTYPAVLWSATVYALSVGWLIVLSESVSDVYKRRDTYGFSSLQAGLVYLSPFVGGILGTAVAGKVSDRVVRFMSSRNDGVYEPEFRLVMALPVALSTTIGLMGFGWSAQERDAWIVPTVFFGVISFGCTLGSTTAITFCVDSYRQYAGEALVTLNFSKNIFHGLVFSLFFTSWLQSDGSKKVFIACGGIQLACLLFTIPLYIFGKRARMWTVRKNLMEKF